MYQFEVLLGVGSSLRHPCLTKDQKLDGAIMSRLFAQKIIWLCPFEDLPCSSSSQLTLDDLFEDDEQTLEISIGVEKSNKKNAEAMQKLHDVYPNKTESELHSALTASNGNAEDAVHLLLDDENFHPLQDDVASSSNSAGNDFLFTLHEPVDIILKNFVGNADNDIWVDVNRDDLWCLCLSFYKIALKHPDRLSKNLCVRFVGSGEMGIDAGALRKEFFSLCLDEVVKRLFEGDLALIPRRGIGSKGIQFEVAGALIAHSVLQGGPGFPFLAEWVVDYLLGEDPSNLIVSKEYISQSEMTFRLLELIKELDKAETPEALHYILEIHAKHDSFWEVINATESSTEVITVENKGCLLHELIFNELIRQRKDQLNAQRDGLQVLGFLNLLKQHCKVVNQVLCHHIQEVTVEQFMSFLMSNPSCHAERQAYQWLLDYATSCDGVKDGDFPKRKLSTLLKFTTGQVGLCDTAITKCSEKVSVNVFSTNVKTVKRVIPKILQKGINDYEKSNDNMTRSIVVYYSGGIMGKRKYRNVYRASSYKKSNEAKSLHIKINNCPIPRLLPYHKLAHYIKSIDIGKLYSIRETLCDGLDEIDKVDGVYRNNQEIVLILARYYLVCQKRYELVWFKKQTYTFNISLGGDGAPFGKDDTSCCWLVSFLNLGRKVLSSNDNYLLFGANCKEDCVPVRRFLQKCLSDISVLEKSTFQVECGGEMVNVRFHVSETPNDMKMLAFLGGELSNAATFFSTFANVSTHNMSSLAGSFSFSGKEMWKTLKYEDRVSAANKVGHFKKTVAKKPLAPATVRSKVTSFIAQLKSRQEFQPIVGRLIDRAHVDLLHLKNNACALTHRLLLHEVIAMSKLGQKVNSFAQVPSNSPFKMYILSMRECNLSRLATKIIKWFDETGANGKSFEYHFTGKLPRLFLLHFMKLISYIEPISEPGRQKTILHILAYICLLLRDCVSIFSQINISNDEIKKLTNLCRDYFQANALFFQVNPTVWTIGNIVPAHTQYMKDKYDLGLGINSMEGREAKHVFIAKYSKNTNFVSRWKQIFRHEFVSLIWFRERGFNLPNERSDHSCAKTYIPKQVSSGDLAYCYCGLQKVCISDVKCRFCADKLMRLIVSSVSSGKNLVFK
ncbi:uncharacterized protein LOC114531418 [Dendronephthya gigantea]|uniref:uncharacterized protein LOC114531418 n=1 Tax=Dendronephthya gigantea TaxID=151771 RepID=UPI00106AB65E|nr:uncharacterized protein LOC114531418 [Dendronephthya gigantea]